VRRVAVVGGGISGLAAAWELVSHPDAVGSLEVTVFDAAPAVGGKLALATVGGVTLDVGAESMLARRPEGVALATEVGAGDRITHPARVSASIVSGGRRWPMPSGTLMGVPSEIDRVRGLLTDDEADRAAAERISPVHGDVSVGDLVDARLGRAVTDKLVEPLLAGVYAGHSREISAELAVPALAAAAHEGRSLVETARVAAQTATATATTDTPAPVFASLVGGLGTLPGLVVDALRAKGVEVRTSTTVRHLTRRGDELVLGTGPTTDEVEHVVDAVVLATPAAATSRLLREEAPGAATALAGIRYASLALVTLALEGKPTDLLEGSGFLVPPTEPLTIKASTFSSVKWPWLAQAHPGTTVLRASVGRAGEEHVLQRSDAELVDVALGDIATVLGRRLPEPVDVHVQRWGGALPQYEVGHRQRVEVARAPLPGVHVCGAAYDGVGIPACIASGRAAARAVLEQLAVPGEAVREQPGPLGMM
jgi:oxygen-dependent protoporphyrinogen oxidase